jgi:nucleoside-diphosphate-sugar epimerase
MANTAHNIAPSIALVGAAGAIGKSIAQALDAQGKPYRVVGRTMSSLQNTFGNNANVQLATWNTDDAVSMRTAFTGIETIVYLVGVNYWQFELHPILMRKTLDAAVAAGVKNILLIGTVYPYGRPQSMPINESHPRNPHTFKGQKRKEQEDILLQAHAEGHINAAVLRLPDFYGPGVEASMLHGAAVAAINGGAADMIGPIDQAHEFVFVPDVGPVVAKVLETPAAYGKVWHLAGAGITSQRAIVTEMEKRTGKKLKLRAAGKWMLRLLGLFNPFMREFVEMHYLITNPVIMDDSALQKLIGPIKKTSYAEGVRQTLAAIARKNGNTETLSKSVKTA